MELAKTDLSALPESERNILTLAGARLLMATAAPHTFEAVTAVLNVPDSPLPQGARPFLCDGWKEIDRRYRAALKEQARNGRRRQRHRKDPAAVYRGTDL